MLMLLMLMLMLMLLLNSKESLGDGAAPKWGWRDASFGPTYYVTSSSPAAEQTTQNSRVE